MGVIGLGGRGSGHVSWFRGIDGVRIVGLCDPDRKRLERQRKNCEEHGEKVKTWTDLRGMLDDPDIDAVAIATCNHWHALAGIWACQAGKDVYCEKPLAHNIWESRKLVEASRKYDRIVQGGTQQRSDPLQEKIKQFLDEGHLGEIKHVRLNRYGKRSTIGKRKEPLSPPDHIDYNLWLGPAADEPIYRKSFQYDWHWIWNTGNGEAGNWGPHIIDDCRNVVFRDRVTLPKRCTAGGGRFVWDDAGDSPNTHFVYYDTGDIPVFFDVHNLPYSEDDDRSDVNKHRRTRAFLVIECEGGYYADGRGGGAAYDENGERIKKFDGDGGRAHAANFIEAVRSRDRSVQNAEVETTHYSTAWCLLANIAYRLGDSYSRGEAMQRLQNSEPWQRLIEGFHEHTKANGVDLAKTDAKLGPMLEIDPERETFTGPTATDEAIGLLRGGERGYRKPFVVPEEV
jgi:predicted dehydrogenase